MGCIHHDEIASALQLFHQELQPSIRKCVGGNWICGRGDVTDTAFVQAHHFADNDIIQIFRINAYKILPRCRRFRIQQEGDLTCSQYAIDQECLLPPELVERQSQIDHQAGTAYTPSQTMDRKNGRGGLCLGFLLCPRYCPASSLQNFDASNQLMRATNSSGWKGFTR